MTNVEIDKICCEFVGIEPINRDICIRCGYPYDAVGTCSMKVLNCQGGIGEWMPEYPPISTSGDAMLRLMDALRSKSIYTFCGATPNGNYDPLVPRDIYFATTMVDGKGRTAYSDSGPMALALAVVELAKQQTERK